MDTTVSFVGIGGYAATILREIFDSSKKGYTILSAVDPYASKSPCYPEICEREIPVYASLDEMYAHEKTYPELVVITTPIQFHTEQILCALKHGSNVLCEKPLTGDKEDIEKIEEEQRRTGKFVAVGYQWSYSRAIQKLKADVLSGIFGKPIFFKSLVFWPRDKAYFRRSTGWAGKIYASNGKKICDSIVNNATAHYIHNILYILGKSTDAAMHASAIKGTLLRVNDIQTFDTATIRFNMGNGAKGLFVVSHSTQKTVEPEFEYLFEHAKIVYSEKTKNIYASMSDGRVFNYGDPFADGAAYKFFCCLDAIQNKTPVPCGVEAAKEQVYFVDELHAGNRVCDVRRDKVKEIDNFLVVEGLDKMLLDCYEQNKLLEELSTFEEIVDLRS